MPKQRSVQELEAHLRLARFLLLPVFVLSAVLVAMTIAAAFISSSWWWLVTAVVAAVPFACLVRVRQLRRRRQDWYG